MFDQIQAARAQQIFLFRAAITVLHGQPDQIAALSTRCHKNTGKKTTNTTFQSFTIKSLAVVQVGLVTQRKKNQPQTGAADLVHLIF